MKKWLEEAAGLQWDGAALPSPWQSSDSLGNSYWSHTARLFVFSALLKRKSDRVNWVMRRNAASFLWHSDGNVLQASPLSVIVTMFHDLSPGWRCHYHFLTCSRQSILLTTDWAMDGVWPFIYSYLYLLGLGEAIKDFSKWILGRIRVLGKSWWFG